LSRSCSHWEQLNSHVHTWVSDTGYNGDHYNTDLPARILAAKCRLWILNVCVDDMNFRKLRRSEPLLLVNSDQLYWFRIHANLWQKTVDGWSQMKVEIIHGGGEMYHLHANCRKRPGAVLQLVKALELLELEIVHANHVCCRDIIVNSVVVQVHPAAPQWILATENSHCLFDSPNLQLLVPAGFVM